MSWFVAVNEKKRAAALADFEAKDRDMMDWGGGRTSTWPAFADVRCKTLTRTTSDAAVYCGERSGEQRVSEAGWNYSALLGRQIRSHAIDATGESRRDRNGRC
jgi:hypothetical protein